MKYPKRSQYRYTKSQYRIRNWSAYEAGLKRRGDLAAWLSATAALDAWRAPANGRLDGQRTYSELAIDTALTIRMVFHLPLRQTEGFLHGLEEMLDVELPLPNCTTLSRHLQTLDGIPFRRLPTVQPIHVLIDSTGLRTHVGHMQNPPRDRAWRKLHLAVDADAGEIIAADLTARRTHDCTPVPGLLQQIPDPIVSFSADGAYDTAAVYEAAHGRGRGRAVRVLIPLGRDAQLVSRPTAALDERYRNIIFIRELGRRKWYTQSDYSARSRVENIMYRYKIIIGRRMRSQTSLGSAVNHSW